MAIAFESFTTAKVNGQNITFCKPSGTQFGDILAMFMTRCNGSGVPLRTNEFSNGTFGHAFFYLGNFSDLHFYVRVVGPDACEPNSYTFSSPPQGQKKTGIMHRISGAATCWDLTTCVAVAYASDVSHTSVYCCISCNPSTALEVFGDPCTCRNYASFVAFSGGAGLCSVLCCLFCCCGDGFTLHRQNSVSGFFGVWQAHSFTIRNCITSFNNGCQLIESDAFCTWGVHMIPTAFLIREFDACVCLVPATCHPRVVGVTAAACTTGGCESCFTVSMPGCIELGDLLITVITRESTAGVINLGCGCNCCCWVLADDHDAVLFPRDIDVFYKVADGTESGTCVTFCGDCVCTRWVGQVMRITGAATCACALGEIALTVGPGVSTQTIQPPLATVGTDCCRDYLIITGAGIFGTFQPNFFAAGFVSPIGFCLINRTEGAGSCSLRVVSMIASKGYKNTTSQGPPWLICNARFHTPWTLGIRQEPDEPPPVPPVLVELCVDNYAGFFGGGNGLDICLILCVTEWREKIETGAIVYGVPFEESLAFAMNMVRFKVQLKGYFPPTVPHEAHPVTDGVPHFPDAVDLEEAALMFNGEGFGGSGVSRKDRARLDLPLPSGVRSYEGVIESVAIINHPGSDLQEFVMQFAVDWSPSFPVLRAWNDE